MGSIGGTSRVLELEEAGVGSGEAKARVRESDVRKRKKT